MPGMLEHEWEHAVREAMESRPPDVRWENLSYWCVAGAWWCRIERADGTHTIIEGRP